MESFPGSPPGPAGSDLVSVSKAEMGEEDDGKKNPTSLMTVSVDHQREKNELLP